MIISVISSKGGVGKTFVSVNLASHFYFNLGYKTLLLDLGGPYSNAVLYSRSIKKIVKPLWRSISITPFYHYKLYDLSVIEEDDIDIIKKLSNLYDYILLDHPPLSFLHYNVFDILRISDKILLITTESALSIRSSLALYKNIVSKHSNLKEKIDIIVNIYTNKVPVSDIETLFEKTIGYIIPFDKLVLESEIYATPLVIYNKSSKASRAIYDIGYHITKKKFYPSILHKLINMVLFGEL